MADTHSTTTEYRFGHLVRIHAPASCFNGLVGEVEGPTVNGGLWVRLRLPDYRGRFGEDVIPFERAEVARV